MNEYNRETDDEIKEGAESTDDKIKAGFKAVGKKIEDPDRELEAEYNKEKGREEVKDQLD